MIARPESLYWTDLYGNKYLDFTAGGGVMNVGWAWKTLADLAADQVYAYTHVGYYGETVQFQQVSYAKELAARFLDVNPEPMRVFFTNGAEDAKRIAQLLVSYPDPHNARIASAADYLANPDGAAAVAMEFVSADYGFGRLDGGIAQRADELARANGVPVMAVEHQTGFGRCGNFMAQQEWNVKADVTILGEAGGGGFAWGAVVAPARLWDRLEPGYIPPLLLPGNEVACAAGRTILPQLTEPVFEHVRDAGYALEETADTLREQFPKIVKEVRGYGLARGLVLADPGLVGPFIREARNVGLILSPCLRAKDTLRMTPPLTISEDEIRRAVVDLMVDVCMTLSSE